MNAKRTSQDLEGTYRQGSITATFSDLQEAFGEPDRYEDRENPKTTVTWGFRFEDGTIATVYDYKAGQTPTTGTYDWHIGGKQAGAAELVHALFLERLVEKVAEAFGVLDPARRDRESVPTGAAAFLRDYMARHYSRSGEDLEAAIIDVVPMCCDDHFPDVCPSPEPAFDPETGRDLVHDTLPAVLS